MKYYDLFTEKTIEEPNPVTKEEIDDNFIVSIPHSGTLFPEWMKEYLNLNRRMLTDLDLFTDRAFDLRDLGGVHIKTKIAAYINMNRARDNFTENGFILKRTMFKEPVYKKELPKEKVEALLTNYYDPYYRYLEEAINKMKGKVLIFDCHSMNSIALPTAPDHGQKRVDFSVITNEGKSCDPKYEEAYYNAMKEAAEAKGLTVNKNFPYKGGYTLKKYANPPNIHVIALEIKRAMIHGEVTEQRETTMDDYQPKPEGIKQTNDIIKKAVQAVLDLFH